MKILIVFLVAQVLLTTKSANAERFHGTILSGGAAGICYAPYPTVLRLDGEGCGHIRFVAYLWGECDGTVHGEVTDMALRERNGTVTRFRAVGTVHFGTFKGQLYNPLNGSCRCNPGEEMPKEPATLRERASQAITCRGNCTISPAVRVPQGQKVEISFESIAGDDNQLEDSCAQRILRGGASPHRR